MFLPLLHSFLNQTCQTSWTGIMSDFCRRAAWIGYFRKCSNNIKPLWETGLLSVFLKFSDSWPSLSWPTSTITAPPWWPRGAPTPLARAWPGRTPRLPRKNHFSETVEIFAKNAKQRVAISHKFRDIFALCWVTLSTNLSLRLKTYWTPATNHWFIFSLQYQVLVVLRKMVFPRKRQPHYLPLGDSAGFQHKSSCSLFLDT